MKAFIVKSYGKKEKLHLTDWAEPTVNENDVFGASSFCGCQFVGFTY